MNNLTKLSVRLIASLFVVLFTSVVLLGQQPPAPAQPAPDTLPGKYEGVGKRPDGVEAKVVLELKKEGSKITGRAVVGETTAEISEATFVDGTLTLKFVGREGELNAKVEGDKITGDWESDGRKGTVELKKVPPAAANAAAAAPINLTGEWEAVADAQGQPFPFTLTLKIDGDKVSGSSSSQLGDSVISTGTWKDGQLNFQMESPNGVVTMSATVIDGKLSGEFDYAGQLQGKWVAVKRK